MSTTAAISIDRNVPLPARDHGRGPGPGPVRAALSLMQVGDSLVVPMIDHDRRKTQIYAGRTGHSLKPKKFSTRQVVENGKRVVRIWRVA